MILVLVQRLLFSPKSKGLGETLFRGFLFGSMIYEVFTDPSIPKVKQNCNLKIVKSYDKMSRQNSFLCFFIKYRQAVFLEGAF